MEADLVRPSSPEDRGRARSRPAGLRPRRAHQSSSLRAQPLLTRVKVEPQEPIPMTKDYRREEKRSKEPWYGLDRTPTSCSDSSSDGEQVSINNNNYSPISKFSEECACCAWCQKAGPANEFSLKTPGGSKVFCSEQCFTQCRRASFKRNKTCDWCRHVRHTVNYVDFQDGDHQLQFCSDKCLNQYKMNIFCKETEAHLEAHPHLRESGGGEAGPGLITPELWLRDCRSPASDGSLSPLPAPLCLDTKKKIEEPLRKEHKKKSRSRTRRVTSPPRVPIHPFPLPPPPVLHPPWRRKPDMPPLLPIARPVPMLPGLLPPPTTLVPYPIIIPIPIPIPIPLPLPGLKMSDLEAAKTPAPESEKGSSLPQPPPRKRKRLSDIQPQDVEAPRKPKIVPA